MHRIRSVVGTVLGFALAATLAPGTALAASPALRDVDPTVLAGVPAVNSGHGVDAPIDCTLVAAEMSWGFKESFRAYIDGTIANGEWTVADGATYETPEFSFRFNQGRVNPWMPIGTVDYDGSIRFTGHGGILDLTIANPELQFRTDRTALLRWDVVGTTMNGDPLDLPRARLVSIDLSGYDLTPRDGVIVIEDAPTTLTAEGAEAIPNYAEGEPFDPVSFTIEIGDMAGCPPPVDNTTPVLIALAITVGGVVLLAVIILMVVLARRRAARQ